MHLHLVHGLDDPVDARIAADGLMLGVDKYNLEIFVRRVLIDPIGVQYPQIGATASHTFFGGRFERALVLQLVDTLVGWFAFEMIQVSTSPMTSKNALN